MPLQAALVIVLTARQNRPHHTAHGSQGVTVGASDATYCRSEPTIR